jgi:hemolysin activation/secretion protein
MSRTDAIAMMLRAEGKAETYLSAPVLFAPTLALRAAGKKVWGTAPFDESAFLGGPSSLRGYYQQRFAGDASLSSSAELRLTLARSHGLFPALWGVFGNTDAGRAYVDGRSPGGWHTAWAVVRGSRPSTARILCRSASHGVTTTR